MVIVAGHLKVEPKEREAYLAGCAAVVEEARATAGCLDFAISPDLVDTGRINIFERWESREAVEVFRGSGPSGDQRGAIRSAAVSEFDISSERDLMAKK